MIIGIGLTLRATLLGSTAVSDPYEVAGFSPSLVFDFAEEFYRTGGSTTTFDAAMTHSRSGNATMVDSDGVLKWAPHNLLPYSEDFTQNYWKAYSSVTTTGNQTVAPDGTLTADRIAANSNTVSNGAFQNSTPLVGGGFSFGVWAKADTVNWLGVGEAGDVWAWFDLANGVVGNKSPTCQSRITSAGSGWYLCEVYDVTSDWTRILLSPKPSEGANDPWNAVANQVGDSIYLWGAHAYRSDLGGMVDNPDTGNSYVPTTSAARYLPRRGHHVYNGTSWVNEGVLVESETPERVQLLHTTNALVTQSHTVTAVPHTLHFTGTGTITLSGASTAGPLVGTGTGENNRVSLTFTPTAASLTLTVSGTVTNAQLEVGSTPSSYIPNLAASGTATRAADTITVPYANLPYDATAMSIQMDGKMTYADTGSAEEVVFTKWQLNTSNLIQSKISTGSTFDGYLEFFQRAAGVSDTAQNTNAFDPGINVPFNIASRHGSTFINGAVGGTALTANTTPTALPDLSATNLQLGYDYMGCIRTFRMWANDLGDTGIAEASA